METVGDKLKAAREKQKMTAADVAKAIRVKTDYITAIEKNEFHKLVAPVYARGFIKLYARRVQLNPAPLLRQFDAAGKEEEPKPAGEKLRSRKETPASKKRRPVRINLAALIGALKKIRLPDINLPGRERWKMPAWPPLELPGKKWLALVIAAVILIIILPVFLRHIAAPGAKIQVPPAGRWLAEPPEPYLEIPAQKSQNRR